MREPKAQQLFGTGSRKRYAHDSKGEYFVPTILVHAVRIKIFDVRAIASNFCALSYGCESVVAPALTRGRGLKQSRQNGNDASC